MFSAMRRPSRAARFSKTLWVPQRSGSLDFGTRQGASRTVGDVRASRVGAAGVAQPKLVAHATADTRILAIMPPRGGPPAR